MTGSRRTSLVQTYRRKRRSATRAPVVQVERVSKLNGIKRRRSQEATDEAIDEEQYAKKQLLDRITVLLDNASTMVAFASAQHEEYEEYVDGNRDFLEQLEQGDGSDDVIMYTTRALGLAVCGVKGTAKAITAACTMLRRVEQRRDIAEELTKMADLVVQFEAIEKLEDEVRYLDGDMSTYFKYLPSECHFHPCRVYERENCSRVIRSRQR
jgi:hypothetical protein